MRLSRSIPLVLLLAALISPGCGEKHPSSPVLLTPRAFRMAMVPFPAEPSVASFLEAFEFVGRHADVVSQHFDLGVPWDSALAGHTPAANITEEFAYRRYRAAQLGLRNHVSLTWLDITRDSLAGGWNGAPRPASIAANPTFANPAVRRALKFWCAWTATYFEPDAFSPGIEINLYARTHPEDWPNLVSLYAEVRDTLKTLLPSMMLFPTWQLDEMRARSQWSLVAAFESRIDALGLSLYPGGYHYTPATLPADYIGGARALTGTSHPLVITETGYGDSALASAGTPGTPEEQRAYVAWLERQADSLGIRQVTWFFPTDPWGILAAAPHPAAFEMFGPMGLRKRTLEPKPALAAWDAALARPFRASP